MAETHKIDGQDINDGTIFEVAEYAFGVAKKRIDVQPFIAKDGALPVPGTNFYNLVEHTLKIRVKGTSVSDLQANLDTLQVILDKENVIYQFKHEDGEVLNYADVLWMEADVDYSFLVVDQNFTEVNVKITAKPHWTEDDLTLEAQTLSPTPAVVAIGIVEGHAPTSCFIEVKATGSESIGDNLIIGVRSSPVAEGSFTPVRDFQGTADGDAFNGEHVRDTGVDNSGWHSLTGNTTDINGIDMLTALIGWRCGAGGLIEKTTDGGDIWTPQTSGTTFDLNKIQVIDASNLYCVGDDGTVLQTSNGGTTWNTKTEPVISNLPDLSFTSATTGWIVSGVDEKIYKTVDSGGSWTEQSTGTIEKVAIYMLNATTGWALDHATNLWKTTDGTNWSGVASGITGLSGDVLRSVWFDDANTGWVVGEGGRVYKSTDGGANWTIQDIAGGTTETLRAVEMFSTSVGWAVGDNGLTIYTSNGGTDWTEQASGTAARLNDLSVFDADKVWAVGGGYELIKTIDAGTNWTQPTAAWSFSSVADYRGTYRVYARVRTADASPDLVQMRVSSGFGGGDVKSNTAVSLADNANWQWVDLGEVAIPVVPVSSQLSPTPILRLEAMGSSGATANFDLDVAVIMPVDGQVIMVKDNASATDAITTDSDNEAINKGASTVTYVGRAPELLPGAVNMVILETQNGNSVGIQDMVITLKYPPKRLSPVA